MFIYVHVYIVCQGYTPRVLTKYSIFRKNTTRAHQNEKICQHAEFFSRVHNLLISRFLSLAFVLFLGRVRSFFVPFLVRGFPPSVCVGRQDKEYYSPKRNPSGSLFPCTHTSSPRLLAKKTPISLSHTLVRSVVCPFLVFSGRYIAFFFFRCLDLQETERA